MEKESDNLPRQKAPSGTIGIKTVIVQFGKMNSAAQRGSIRANNNRGARVRAVMALFMLTHRTMNPHARPETEATIYTAARSGG